MSCMPCYPYVQMSCVPNNPVCPDGLWAQLTGYRYYIMSYTSFYYIMSGLLHEFLLHYEQL